MKLRTVLPGLGIVAAAFGLAALVVDRSAMGLVAGVLGLVTGTLAVIIPRREASTDRARARLATPADDAPPEAAPSRPVEQRSADAGVPEGRSEPDVPLRLDTVPGPGGLSERDPGPQPDEVAAVAGAAGSPLLDPATGLFGEEFFRVVTESRIAAARRHLRPVALVLVEVVEGPPTDPPIPVDSVTVSTSITSTLREADIACRFHNGYFALLLEDTPENGAIWTVERIRRHLAEASSGKTLWAGVACYPAHAFSHAELMTAAESALVAAREWRQDRIEVATLAP
ncbi:MAG: GGDEF domain-containing protein [Acidimicrobiales bacterium]